MVASKLIIGEYGGKVAAVIICYPINQKKILNAECLIICGFIIIAELFSCFAVTDMAETIMEVGDVFAEDDESK